MPLSHSLDAPLGELGLWLENESPRVLPENLRGQCCVALRELDETRQGKILDSAARVRFQAKAGQFRARARHAGWEQALWEGLFRALGYKHNIWPMQNLAESRLRWTPGVDPAFVLQARLLGISGLLPAELTRAQAGGDGYLRRVWDCWWRERDAFSDCILPRAVLNFTDCVRPIIPNAGSRWPRTGWRREIWFQDSNIGVPRIFQMAGPRCREAWSRNAGSAPLNWWIRFGKFLKWSATNFGRGTGRSARRG